MEYGYQVQKISMKEQTVILTAEGYLALEQELNDLKMVKRPAVIKALKLLKHECYVRLYSDSAYVVNAFNQGWIYNWQKNGWKTADKIALEGGIGELSLSGGEPFLHPDLFEMVEYAKSFNIKTVIFTSGIKKTIPLTTDEIEFYQREKNNRLLEIEKNTFVSLIGANGSVCSAFFNAIFLHLIILN